MFDRLGEALSLFLPDPRDKTDAPLYPHRREYGLYRFTREPADDIVVIEEPSGDTYELVWFSFCRYLRSILKLAEQDRITIEDRLWNFFAVETEIVAGQLFVPIRTFDPKAERLKEDT